MGAPSTRTRDQSASSSSASTMAKAVCTPWPISLLGMTTTTVSSLPSLSQPLKATCPGCTGSGWLVVSRCRAGNRPQPIPSAPVAARVPRMNRRRVLMRSCSTGLPLLG